MRKFISIVNESGPSDELQKKLIAAINGSLTGNYSGIDYGEAESAAYDIANFPNITRDEVKEIIKNVGSYDPYEGFDNNDIEDATLEVCFILNIE